MNRFCSKVKKKGNKAKFGETSNVSDMMHVCCCCL